MARPLFNIAQRLLKRRVPGQAGSLFALYGLVSIGKKTHVKVEVTLQSQDCVSFSLYLFFKDRLSLCIPGGPGTH